jgi:CheY-like chemotaxis protein
MIRRILIVDDSGISRKVVQHCLEYSGLKGREFLHADNGISALAVLDTQPIDLLVTDLSMPVMDGHQLLRVMSSRPELAGVKVIVSTSLASGAWEAELKRFRVGAVVRKPLTQDSFSAVLSRFESIPGGP